MTISTSYFYDRATFLVTNAQSKVAYTQAQIANGKELVAPSDQPDKAVLIDNLRVAISRQESITENLKTVDRRYAAEETALSSSIDLMLRIKDLALNAVNDTPSPSDREAIATEMAQLKSQLVKVANSQDEQGQYIFSGASVGTEPFAQGPDGRVSYQGDQTSTRLSAGDKRLFPFNHSGSEVFTRVLRTVDGVETGIGFFDAIDDLIAAVRAGDNSAMQRGIAETDKSFDGLALALVETGADRAAVEFEGNIIDNTLTRLKSTLSDIEDLNLAEALARMNKQMLSLEAAMSSFGRISQLSLFDYIQR